MSGNTTSTGAFGVVHLVILGVVFVALADDARALPAGQAECLEA